MDQKQMELPFESTPEGWPTNPVFKTSRQDRRQESLPSASQSNVTHPGLDAAWQPVHYQYRDEHLEVLWTTGVHLSLEEALVAMEAHNATFILRRFPDENDYLPLPYMREQGEVRKLVNE